VPQPAQKKHRLHASVFAVVKDADGQIVDRFGQDFLYEVPDDQLAGIQATPIDYRHQFNLPAGRYTVESVLLDREAQARASTSTVEFDSPPAKGVGLSSLMLVARADPLTAEPEADDPLVFKDKELVPLLGGSLKASSQLPAPDSSGAIPVLVNAATKAGNCEIKITALQGFQQTTRSVTYTVPAQ
jgi:hypothetical protein